MVQSLIEALQDSNYSSHLKSEDSLAKGLKMKTQHLCTVLKRLLLIFHNLQVDTTNSVKQVLDH